MPYFSEIVKIKWIIYYFSPSFIVNTEPLEQNLYGIFANKYDKIQLSE